MSEETVTQNNYTLGTLAGCKVWRVFQFLVVIRYYKVKNEEKAEDLGN